MEKQKKITDSKQPYIKYDSVQSKIYDSINALTTPASPIPSYKEIAKDTGLSVVAVTEHFKTLNFDYLRNRARIHTPAVIDAIARGAMEGKSNSQKLFMQIVEKLNLDNKGKVEIPKDDAGKMDVNKSVEGTVNVNIVRHIVNHKDDLKKIDNLNKTGSHPPHAITIEDEKGLKMLPPPVQNIEIAEECENSQGVEEINNIDDSVEDMLEGSDFFNDIGIDE